MIPPRLRCALYTRKSSDEGLDQAFNSLHAQREACEAYVKSQAGEGWRALVTAYDDGGFSGGSMDRPGLRKLLADIASGRVDIVVVYKIDRLTRSLGDFARMVEVFDANKVSFVSVTQAFNTTTSMGRLTLNVLLSFAQFEREVTGERIRDKIAASKARGMWMGGIPPLGYDPPTDPTTRALVVNPAEAATVRQLFEAYLDLGSAHRLQRWLADNAVVSKAWVTTAGRSKGGLPFSRGALFHMLRNRVYRGMIVHGALIHPGAHAAIIDEALFDAVQARLSAGARRTLDAQTDRVAAAPLKGRIFDADGEPMSPTFTHGSKGQVYRYYVSAPLQQGGRRDPHDPSVRRVPAAAIEARLASIMTRLLPPDTVDPMAPIARVEVYPTQLEMLLPVALLPGIRSRCASGERAERDPVDPAMLRLTLPVVIRTRGGRNWILGGDLADPAARRDPILIRALRAAHDLVEYNRDGMPIVATVPATQYQRRLIRLAFIAPSFQAAILAGRQEPGLTIDQLIAAPPALLWRDQIATI